MFDRIGKRTAAGAAALCVATSAPAQPLEERASAPASAQPAPPREDSPWSPPEPSPRSFDWIRLASGEWLKGEIERMRDDTLDFESDELDDLELDWADVVELRSPRPHTYVFEGRHVATGTARMREGRIAIRAEGEPLEFERAALIRIVSGDRSERNWWSGKLSVGLLGRSGNTESADFTASFNLAREAPVTRLTLDYNGALSYQDGAQTADNDRARLAFDMYVSRRLFFTVPSLSFYRDVFQNIDHQITPGAGIGYDLIMRKRVDWSIGLGAAYQYTAFISTTSADARTAEDLAVVFSTEIDLDLTGDIELDNHYQLQYVATNPGLTTHHADSTLSFDIWGPLELDVAFVWDRVEQPVADQDGVLPESNDYRVSVGIGIEF